MPVAVENDVCFADLKPLLLEYQIGEEIAEFGGEDADTRAYQWLTAYAAEYGFILRYPRLP